MSVRKVKKMSQKVIKGTPRLAEAIRSRRRELGLTIEESAFRAGVGVKTWCRYESGGSIRQDKTKGICKTLNWHTFPSEDDGNDIVFNIDEYKSHEAWSEFISNNYGETAAISFVIGSDIILDNLDEDLEELSALPKGTHVGQLAVSMTKDILPSQFLMRYDYDFLYCLKTTVLKLRRVAHHSTHFSARSVMEELAIYLCVEESKFLMECMMPDMEACGVDGLDTWDDWAFDLFDDMDIVTCLYSNYYVTNDHIYHFDHWTEEQFYT